LTYNSFFRLCEDTFVVKLIYFELQDLTAAKSLLYKVIILFEKCLQMIWLPHAINVKLNLYNDTNTQAKNVKTTELEKAERFETEKNPSMVRIYCYPGPFYNCNINRPLIDFCSHSIFWWNQTWAIKLYIEDWNTRISDNIFYRNEL
jgi:hypothetical protein